MNFILVQIFIISGHIMALRLQSKASCASFKSIIAVSFVLLQFCPFLSWKEKKQLRDTEPFLKSNFPPCTLFVL